MPILFPYPSDPIQTSLKREGLLATSNAALALASDLRASVRSMDAVSPDQLTWENTFGIMDRIHFALSEAADVPALLSMVHPDALLREEARGCEPRVEAFITDLYMDDTAYRVLRHAASVLSPHATPEQQKLMDDILRDYRKNGLELKEPERERLKKLNEELTKLQQAFEQHISEAKASIQISPEQLSGLPDQYIASHQPNEEGVVTITSDPPDCVPFLRYADDRKAAQELFIKTENRAATLNLPVLDKVIALRKKKAAMLGYKTWADFVLEDRMAKTPDRVFEFLNSLHEGLRPIREQETKTIERVAVSNGATLPINDPDSVYYAEKVRSIEYGLDSKRLSEYFELASVERGIMDIASSLYQITFRLAEKAPVWHPDVRAYDIFDREHLLLARIYLDLYPRDNKFKHAGMFTLRPTIQTEGGTRIIPLLALVCNFPKPGEQPALLDHGQVTTFFHEFGHCLHLALSRAQYASQSGTKVAHDFVEVPSQLFEEWAWNRETLSRFARHFETDEPLPEELHQAMQKARRFGVGIATERQLLYANLDLAYHTRQTVDTTEILKELFAVYCPFERIPETYFQSHFGHLMGYDASYYGYQWALTIAKDLFTRFQTAGIMNADTAQAYLHAILERGGSDDEGKIVEAFLGRPFSPNSYLKFLGINC